MAGENPDSALRRLMRMARTLICLVSMGFIYPHAFTESLASEPTRPQAVAPDDDKDQNRRGKK